jgi:hypothetical protein
MKNHLKLLALFVAPCALTFSLAAAESATAVAETTASPTGTWTWGQQGRDGTTFEQTLTLEYVDGKLTGTLLGGQRPQGQMPDIAIGDASFNKGALSFTVTREFNGNQFVIKYEGRLAGDKIDGTIERPGRDGGAPVKREWHAARKK